MHRLLAREVELNLLDDALLSARQRERQSLVKADDELAVDHVADADGFLLERPLAQHERELHPQQLVEHEPAAGDALRVHGFGRVDRAQGPLTALELQSTHHARWHRVGDAPRSTARQRRLDPARDLPRRQSRLL